MPKAAAVECPAAWVYEPSAAGAASAGGAAVSGLGRIIGVGPLRRRAARCGPGLRLYGQGGYGFRRAVELRGQAENDARGPVRLDGNRPLTLAELAAESATTVGTVARMLAKGEGELRRLRRSDGVKE